MKPLQFGDRVLVLARVVPVVGSSDGNGGMVFRQATPPRDIGRLVVEDLDESTWPGEAVPPAWVEAPESFDLEPAGPCAHAYRRLRRIRTPVPVVGVVIGFTHKLEGTLREGTGGGELGGPGRRIELYEVAVPPPRSSAKMVFAHGADLQAMQSVQ